MSLLPVELLPLVPYGVSLVGSQLNEMALNLEGNERRRKKEDGEDDGNLAVEGDNTAAGR